MMERKNGNYYLGFRVKGLGVIVPLQWIEYGVHGDLIIYTKAYSTHPRGTIGLQARVGKF